MQSLSAYIKESMDVVLVELQLPSSADPCFDIDFQLVMSCFADALTFIHSSYLCILSNNDEVLVGASG